METSAFKRSGGFISRAKVKSIKMTFAIVLAFIFCWSTFYVYNFLMVFKVIQYRPELMVLTIFVQSLAPLNSAVNPIIYFLFKNSKSTGVKNNRTYFLCFKTSSRLKTSKNLHLQQVVRNRHPLDSINNINKHNNNNTNLVNRSKIPENHSGVCGGMTVETNLVHQRHSSGSKDSPKTPSQTLTNQITFRRYSTTPYVRPSLSEAENEILLKHVTGEKNFRQENEDNKMDETAAKQQQPNKSNNISCNTNNDVIVNSCVNINNNTKNIIKSQIIETSSNNNSNNNCSSSNNNNNSNNNYYDVVIRNSKINDSPSFDDDENYNGDNHDDDDDDFGYDDNNNNKNKDDDDDDDDDDDENDDYDYDNNNDDDDDNCLNSTRYEDDVADDDDECTKANK